MDVESRLEGGTLVVRIPMRLGRQRGRTRILAPNGNELTPPTKPQPDGALGKALARAWRWQKLLDRGVFSSVTEIAEAEKISTSYVSRVRRSACWQRDRPPPSCNYVSGCETSLARWMTSIALGRMHGSGGGW
jgi:hypothetical protein